MERLRKRLVDLMRIPLETADLLFALSNGGAIIGGILAVLGTFGIFLFGSVREHYAAQQQSELSARTAEARRDAALANERAAQLNKESEALQLELERERKERLELERRIAPRRVSERLRQDLKVFGVPDQKALIHLRVAGNNAEGDRLINEIGAACVEAGWQLDQLSFTTCVGVSFPEGITVAVNPDEASASVHMAAAAFAAAVYTAGLAVVWPQPMWDGETPLGTFSLSAGMKPNAAVT